MKERPILFSGAMVRAILEGRKTVTRRVVKPVPYGDLKWNQQILGKHVTNWTDDLRLYECPYGQPGDRLWVRETWARVGNTDPGYLVYRATYPACLPPGLERVPADIRDAGYRWRPSIHMPRANSRILLEITAVRVERLQDISEEQAKAEGAPMELAELERTVLGAVATYCAGFARLWQSINGAESWSANPWVWVVEFKRVTP